MKQFRIWFVSLVISGAYAATHGRKTNSSMDESTETRELIESFCDDDHSYNSIFGKKSNNCKWVARYPEIRCELEWRGTRVKEKCPLTCGTCSSGCVDNPNYYDVIGFDCDYHKKATSDCNLLSIVGYTEEDIGNLVKNCPESCGYCERESKAPSSTPSQHSTNKPTFNPTFEPTLEPTLEPTFYITSMPTPKPTFGPTSDPTAEPASKLSLIPSTYPSTKPIKEPTSSPTHSPSKIPTKYPTESPSLHPSAKVISLSPTLPPTLYPTISPTKLCYDDILFIDAFGLTCKHHTISICAKMGVMGYSPKQVKQLVKSCPLSCGYCETAVPTSIPSVSPSEIPSLIPSEVPSVYPSVNPSTTPSSVCHDNPLFRDFRGLSCGRHVTSVCSRVGVLGYPKLHVKALMVNCPRSCGYCDTISPSLLPSNEPSWLPSSLPSPQPTSKPTETCHDLRTFKDHLGLSCKDHTYTECTNVGSIGYKPFQVKTLVSSCPKSCGFCVTTVPSHEPSKMPSDVPLEAPTGIPTLQPSLKPSSSCHDRNEYRDHIGLTCSNHGSPISCNSELMAVGYTRKQVVNLRANCPKSCGLCSSEAPSDIPSTIKPSASPNFEPTKTPSDSPKERPTKRPTKRPTASNGWTLDKNTCSDNALYLDHLGLDCSFYKTIVCSEMKIMGFKPSQVNALKSNCPLSCGICLVTHSTDLPTAPPSRSPMVLRTTEVTKQEMSSRMSPSYEVVSTNFFGLQIEPLFETFDTASLKRFNQIIDNHLKGRLVAEIKEIPDDVTIKVTTTILDQIVVEASNTVFLDITLKKNIDFTPADFEFISESDLEAFVENYFSNSEVKGELIEEFSGSKIYELSTIDGITYSGYRGIGVARAEVESTQWVSWISNPLLITLCSAVVGLALISLFTAFYIHRRRTSAIISVGSSFTSKSSTKNSKSSHGGSQKSRPRSRNRRRKSNGSDSNSKDTFDEMFASGPTNVSMESGVPEGRTNNTYHNEAVIMASDSMVTKEQPLKQQDEISNKIASMIASPAAFIGQYAGEHINSISFSPFSFGSASFSTDKILHVPDSEDAHTGEMEHIVRHPNVPVPGFDNDRPNLADIEKTFGKKNAVSKGRKHNRSHSPKAHRKVLSKSAVLDDRPSIDAIERSFTPTAAIKPIRTSSGRTSRSSRSLSRSRGSNRSRGRN